MPIPKPKSGEQKDEFISRCMGDDKMVTEFTDEAQRYRICLLQFDAEIKAQDSYTDYPKAASENAAKALKFRLETKNKNNCGTPVGWARANQLAKREPISRDTIARMASFERHRQNSKVPYEDGCGGLMWDAWGGDEGISWAQNKLKEIDSIKNIIEDKKKVSFDYDSVLSTKKGQELALSMIKNTDIYIISARHHKPNMYKLADELSIPHERIFATGSNKAKIEKIKELGINTHYDNNQNVIKELGSIGKLYK